jgi:hypothetical protein
VGAKSLAEGHKPCNLDIRYHLLEQYHNEGKHFLIAMPLEMRLDPPLWPRKQTSEYAVEALSMFFRKKFKT